MLKAKDFRHQAWDKLKGNWGAAIIVTLIMAVITGVLGGLSAIGIGAIIELIVMGPLTLGVTMFYLSIVRNSEVKIGTMFAGFKNFATALLSWLLTAIFTALWSLLFIIPGIIKSYSYSMTMYILADHPELSATEAITESRRLMDGNKWRLFCLHFSFIGWILLSALTFGILMLWVKPYMEAAQAEFYNSLVNGEAVEVQADVVEG